MESMSSIPYLLKNARFEGFKMGDRVLEDGWSDSIDPICDLGMGQTAEILAKEDGIGRQQMDAYAVTSHEKAISAAQRGLFENELVPVKFEHTDGRGDVVVEADEGPRSDCTETKLASLRSVFRDGGSVTAGNSCGLSDGACGLLLTTREVAAAAGVPPLFSILAYAQTAVDGKEMGRGPTLAIPKVSARARLKLDDVDLLEVNEAFAAQVLSNEMALRWNRDRLNIHGGAIALGHPTGASGARIVVTLHNALVSRNKEIGLASICGAGGVATALVIRRES